MAIVNNYIQPLKNIVKDKHFRTWLRLYYQLKSKPGKTVGSTKFDNYNITYADALSFIFQYKEIFVHEYYRFTATRKDPVIIDCGANIGMCCLYFKKLFPDARILAFEPDAMISSLLRDNVFKNNLSDIQIFQSAVWKNNDGIQFFPDGADGGSLFGSSENQETVPTIRLKEVLEKEKHIDLLKIDIEGAEGTVIQDCQSALKYVDHIYLEYHSFAGKKQELAGILRAFEDNGFHYTIGSLYKQKHPLVQPIISHGMDLQLHIFAKRLKQNNKA